MCSYTGSSSQSLFPPATHAFGLALHIVSTMHLIHLKSTSYRTQAIVARSVEYPSTSTSPNQLNNRKPSSVRHQRLKEPSNRSTSTQPGCDASDRSRSAMHSLNLYLYKRRPRWHGRGAAAAVAEELVEDEGNIHPVSRMFVCVQAVRRRGRSPSHTTPSNSCNCDALAGWLCFTI